MTKRGKIRLTSFILATLTVLSIMDIKYYIEKNKVTQTLGYVYTRSVEDLANNVDNIKNDLNKGMYCADNEMLSKLANNIQTHAQSAKSNLAQLPVTELNLENTYKFLSQVGDYSLSLSEKCADGSELSEDEYSNLKSLYEYSSELSNNMWALEQELQLGMVDFSEIKADDTENVTVDSGFKDFEDSFEQYPTLIYDGPFSDHILTREPQLIKGKEMITEDEALNKAKGICRSDALTYNGAEGGKMSSYTFTDGYNTVAITTNGGYVSYLLRDRSVGSISMSTDDAISIATDFIKHCGYDEVKMTYYEIVYNTCTMNFAAVQDGVTVYTDLIKVSVAMDSGEILGFDARGYITNHTQRAFSEEKISADEAQKNLSPLLNVKSVSSAVIPTDGENDAYCYEFYCTNEASENILVYVNKQSGKEEQILMLIISDSGVLTI